MRLAAWGPTIALALAPASGCRRAPPVEPPCEVHRDSSVDGSEIRTGTLRPCTEAESVALGALRRARNTLDPALAPGSVSIHVEPRVVGGPPVTRVEVHRTSGAILIDPRFLERMTAAAWLHELAHVKMAGPISDQHSLLQRRLFLVLEEGIADAVAAHSLGDPTLGGIPARPPSVIRTIDLSRAAGNDAGAWAGLAGERFDPHALGESWAGHLYRADAGAAALSRLAECARAARAGATAAEGAHDIFAGWLAACPAGSATARELLVRWLPAELAP